MWTVWEFWVQAPLLLPLSTEYWSLALKKPSHRYVDIMQIGQWRTSTVLYIQDSVNSCDVRHVHTLVLMPRCLLPESFGAGAVNVLILSFPEIYLLNIKCDEANV